MKLNLPLKTERLVIKQFTEHDEEHYYRLVSDRDYVKEIGSPITKDKAHRQLQGVIERYKQSSLGPLMAYEVSSNKVIGLCGLDLDDSGEGLGIFYAVLPQFREQGYATEMNQKLIESAFSTSEVDRIVARVSSDNTASIHLLEKLGMVYLQSVHDLYDDKEKHLYVLYKDQLSKT